MWVMIVNRLVSSIGFLPYTLPDTLIGLTDCVSIVSQFLIF